MTAETKWRCGDILDLEFILKQDENRDEEELTARDRKLFLKRIQPVLGDRGDDSKNRGWMIRVWLDEMRKKSDALVLPGTWFDRVMAFVTPLSVVTGMGMGLSLCAPFFAYTGTRPVNVFYFFSVLVVVQMLLLFLLITLVVSAIFRKKVYGPLGAVYDLAALVVRRLAAMGLRRIDGHISGETRLALTASLGMIRAGSRRYGRIFFWPFFNLIQLLGIGVNLGILATILFRIIFFDTAFGWQSTLQMGSEFVYRAVTILSLPWSWFIPPEFSHPDLAAIQGSRMILKEGVAVLATRDLVSWWPFLFLSVLFYGLIPRLLAWSWGRISLGRALARISFDTAPCRFLVQRLSAPRIRVETGPDGVGETLEPSPFLEDDFSPSSPTGGFLALLPEELFHLFDPSEFPDFIMARTGIRVERMEAMGLDPAGNEKMVSSFLENGGGGVLLVLEAWQPPIRETLGFISFIRSCGEKRCPLMVGLVGKPLGENPLTRVAAMDFELWRKKIGGLGDPGIMTLALVKS